MSDIELAKSLMQKLGICEANTDVLVITDGSGTTYKKSAGWAYTAFYPKYNMLAHGFGSVSHGTNNYAELAPIVHFLWKDIYENNPENRKIEIVSDSELTVKQGKGIYARNTNRIQWASIKEAESLGYSIGWNHVSRNSNPFSSWADKIASQARKSLDKLGEA